MVNFYDNGQTGGYTGPGIPDVTKVVNPRQPATNNYLASNFFNLEITRLPTVTYFCQSVGIPSLNLTPVDQPTPMGVYPKFIGGRYTFEDLTVNFIVDENMKNWLEVYQWMKEIGNMENTTDVIDGSQTSDFFSDILVVVTNSVYKPNLHIRFIDAFPIALSGFQFNSLATDTEPITASATFSYTLYEIDEL